MNYATFWLHIYVNTLRPEQNGWHFVDNILKLIFLHENCCILIRISLKFVLNSFWPSDPMPTLMLVDIGSGNGLCLMAPSHYLNQCWLIISKVLWWSSEIIILIRSEDTNQWNWLRLKITISKSCQDLPRNNELILEAILILKDSCQMHIFCRIKIAIQWKRIKPYPMQHCVVEFIHCP